MSSVDFWASTRSGVMPQATDSWRAVRGSGVAAMIRAVGRNREMARAVVPLFVQAMIAAHSASRAARQAAAERAVVIRTVGLALSFSADCWRPRLLPQPT